MNPCSRDYTHTPGDFKEDLIVFQEFQDPNIIEEVPLAPHHEEHTFLATYEVRVALITKEHIFLSTCQQS